MANFRLRAGGCRGYQIHWKGHELVVLENSRIRCSVSLTRGAEILELRDKTIDLDVLWHGHSDITANRGGVVSVNRPEGNFLDHFAGGWQEILPSGGNATTYKGASFGQHGEVALLPWDMEVLCDEEDELSVEFRVLLRTMPLSLSRRMTIRSDCAEISIHEELANHSNVEIDVMWGHHISLGGPLVESGAKICFEPESRVSVPVSNSPSYRWAAGTYSWPNVRRLHKDSEVDTQLIPADDGTEGHLIIGPLTDGRCEVRSPNIGRAMTVTWETSIFPYAWCWFVYGGHEEWPLWGRHRLITIEPFTSPLTTLDAAVASRTSMSLPARESVETTLSVSFDQCENGSNGVHASEL